MHAWPACKPMTGSCVRAAARWAEAAPSGGTLLAALRRAAQARWHIGAWEALHQPPASTMRDTAAPDDLRLNERLFETRGQCRRAARDATTRERPVDAAVGNERPANS